MKVRVIHQVNLTSECWSVQSWGLEYCEACEYKDSKDCGGQEILRTSKNSFGKNVPVQ